MAELFVELYGEDFPGWAQEKGSRQLADLLYEALKKRNLLDERADSIGYASPRRFAVQIKGVLPESKAQEIETRGPREGANEKALEGFLRKAGFSSTEDEGVELRETPKGKFWFATKLVPPSSAEIEIPEAIVEALLATRWRKSMRWDASGFRWPRPLRRYTILLDGTPLCLHDSERLPSLRGGTNEIEIGEEYTAVSSKEDWLKVLKAKGIEPYAEPNKRDAQIVTEPQEMSMVRSFSRFHIERPSLLVIHPKAKNLPESFVPVILKYHLGVYERSEGGYYYSASLPYGLEGGAESEWEQKTIKQVEKVAQARLDDARFYWERDKKIGVKELQNRLDKINFHPKLGSVRMRAERIADLTKWIVRKLEKHEEEKLNSIHKAVSYSLCDLASGTVNEIPSLEGEVGSALFTIEKNFSDYKNFPLAMHLMEIEGEFSVQELSICLASALDYLVGFIAAGERATGSTDPYALRGYAGLIFNYLIDEKTSLLDLNELIEQTVRFYYLNLEGNKKKLPKNVPDFIRDESKLKESVKDLIKDRFEYHLQWSKRIPYDVTRAVLNSKGEFGFGEEDRISFALIEDDANCLHKMLFSPETGDSKKAEKLIRAWRRAQGLLKGINITSDSSDGALSGHGQQFEKALRRGENQLKKSSGGLLRVNILLELSDPVDYFLDIEKVLEGTEQEQQARLALLDRFIQVVKRVADLDYIEGGDITARKDSARLNQG